MFSKGASGKTALIADIDDSSVGVSIISTASEGPASILFAERKSLPIEERSSAQSASAVLQLFEQCLDSTLKAYAGSEAKKAPKLPRDVYVVLRAPWTRFRTAEMAEHYPEPRTITKDMIPALAKKALATPSDLDRGNLLDAGIMRVSLNGYPTANPVGKKATLMSVVAFESSVDPDMKRGALAAIEKFLPGRTPVIHAGMRALLTLLHEHVPDIHRFLVLDVGGSNTNCAVVRKESVAQVAVVPEGKMTIVKRLSGTGLPEETLTRLRMLAMDTCSTEACEALKESIARSEPELVKKFGETLTSLAAQRRLPNAAMLLAPAELSPWLSAFFSRIDFSQFTATMQPFDVESLSADHLQDVVVWKAGTPADTGISVAAGYVNSIQHMD